ncbi:uncharacterized protein LOC111084053, partial [Limulus polyphemus]|uniref:Uncharacterized protein LOC111084053 n=1 Tax=Limulus polyphemus TaxID=6850 RepID=A0ABM1RYT6_LIMPO
TDLLKRKKLKEHPGTDKLRRPSSIVPNQQVRQRSRSLYVPQVGASREHLVSNPEYHEQKEPATSDTLTLNTDRSGSQVPFRESTPNREPPQTDPKVVNYLHPSSATMSNETLSRSPHGSFRRQNNLSFRDREVNYTLQQAMSDHLDQYGHEHVAMKPSFRGSQSPQRMHFPKLQTAQTPSNISHQPTDYAPDCTPDSGVSESMDNDDLFPGHVPRRSTLPNLYAESFQGQTDPGLVSFVPSDSEAESNGSMLTPQTRENASYSNPKRTVSLYGGVAMRQPPSQPQPSKPGVIKRKKSLPDVQVAAMKAKVMTRAEVSELSSQRRGEVRRMMVEAERLRTNPLLYVFNPGVKEWFSKQQLVIMVLFVNISLAIMFFKLLT